MNQNTPNNTSTNVAAQIMDANAISEDIASMIQDAMGGLSRLLRRTRVRNNQQNDDQKSSEPDLIVNLTHLQQNAECYRVNFDQTWKTFIGSIKKYLQPSPVEYSFYINAIKSSNNIPYNYHGLLSSKVRRGDIIIVVHDENIVITIQTNGNNYTLKRKFKSTDTIFDIKRTFESETGNKLDTINLYQQTMGYMFEDKQTLRYYRITTSCTMNNIPSTSSYDDGKAHKKKKVKIDKAQFIQASSAKKDHYDTFPTLQDYANGSSANDAKIGKLTKEILSKKPSGDAANRDTFLHVLDGIAGSNGKKCLFFDSSQNILPQSESDKNSYLNMVDADDPKAPKFVLKLKKLDSFVDDEKFDKVEKIKEIKEALSNDAFHPIIEDIRGKLAKAHNVNIDRIVITDFYLNGVGAPYYIRDLTQSERDKIQTQAAQFNKKMDTLFPDFDSCAIHPALYHHMYDVNMFDERGNKTFGPSENATYKVGPPGKEKDYKQPAGWTRYGLKVLGNFPGGDKWLDPFQDPGNWYRAYHGTDVNAGGWIIDKGFVKSTGNVELFPDGQRRSTAAACGPGVYCSPNVDTVVNDGYAKTVTIDTNKGRKSFKYVLMVAVNPANLNSTKTGGPDDYWVAPEAKDIRPYGILIKEI